MGKIRHRDIIYDGAHEPLIGSETWHQVQDVLAGRRIAGDRSWRHTHYLKGSLVCHHCGGRMGYGHSRGKGGVYSYFFCLGRHTGRTNSDLPYISVEKVEAEIERIWQSQVQFTAETIREVSELSCVQLGARQEHDQALLASQRQRLIKLERQKQNLIDAYLDEAIPAEDLKPRQARLMAEMNDANRLIAASQNNMALVRKHLELVLALLGNAGRLYRNATPEQRKWLNQAVFSKIAIDLTGDDNPHPTQETLTVEIAGELAEPVTAVTGLTQLSTGGRKGRLEARHGATGPTTEGKPSTREGQNGTPGQLSRAGGFNLTNLADRVAFEIQYSPLNPDAWQQRHDSYQRQDIVDVWLFGNTPTHLKIAPDGQVALNPTHEAVLNSGSALLFINPEQAIVGVTVGSARRLNLATENYEGKPIAVLDDLIEPKLELVPLSDCRPSTRYGLSNKLLDSFYESTHELRQSNRETAAQIETNRAIERQEKIERQRSWEVRRSPQQDRIRHLMCEVDRWNRSEAQVAVKNYFGEHLRGRIDFNTNPSALPGSLIRWQCAVYFEFIAGRSAPFGTRDAFNTIVHQGVKMGHPDAFKLIVRYLYRLEKDGYLRQQTEAWSYPKFTPTVCGAWW